MTSIITTIHILVCITIILVILLQAGKGAGMGAAFGGSSQTIFGSTGAASFLSKLTTVVAVVFMLTSLTLTLLSGPRGVESIMDLPGPATQSVPAPEAPEQTARETSREVAVPAQTPAREAEGSAP